jgi:hypothetical protein
MGYRSEIRKQYQNPEYGKTDFVKMAREKIPVRQPIAKPITYDMYDKLLAEIEKLNDKIDRLVELLDKRD